MACLSNEHVVILTGQRKRTAEDDVAFYLMMAMIQELQLRAVAPHQQELFICPLPSLRNMTGAHPHQSAPFEDICANAMEHPAFFSLLFWRKAVAFLFLLGGNLNGNSEQTINIFSLSYKKKKT